MGQRIWLQDQQTKRWTIEGVIKSIRDGGRSFVVETGSGAYLRNRRYIKAASSRIRQEVAEAIRRANYDGKETKRCTRRSASRRLCTSPSKS